MNALSALWRVISRPWGKMGTMEPNDFKKWRKALGVSQKDAAHLLGLKRRMIQYYEKGERNGDKVRIPRSVRLACYALSEGVADYNGPHRKIVKIDAK
jgi:transcriptional regulator with XRE-family HTH domain